MAELYDMAGSLDPATSHLPYLPAPLCVPACASPTSDRWKTSVWVTSFIFMMSLSLGVENWKKYGLIDMRMSHCPFSIPLGDCQKGREGG